MMLESDYRDLGGGACDTCQRWTENRDLAPETCLGSCHRTKITCKWCREEAPFISGLDLCESCADGVTREETEEAAELSLKED